MARAHTSPLLWMKILLVGLAALLPALAGQQQMSAQGTVVRLQTPAQEIREDSGSFEVLVMVENATNLGAFQFTLGFDPSKLRFEGVSGGPFLGSSGRQMQCPDPKVTKGSVSFICVTLGASPPEGAAGTGQLATVVLSPRNDGTSPLTLSDVKLVSPPGDLMPSASEDASMVILPGPSGFPWLVWGPVIGVGALAGAIIAWLVVMRVRGRPAGTAEG